MNTIPKNGQVAVPKAAKLFFGAVLGLGLAVLPQKAQAVVNYTYGAVYSQNFDTNPAALGTSLANLNNNSPFTSNLSSSNDWFTTVGNTGAVGSAVTNFAGTFTSGFYDMPGTSGSALGSIGGSSGTGYYVLALQNTQFTLDKFTLSFNVVGVSNGGAVSNLNVSYGFSSTPVTDNFDFANQVSLVDPGATAGQISTLTNITPGGPLTTVTINTSWAAGSYLYFAFSSTGNNSLVGIDNLTFSAVPEPSTWIIGSLLVAFAGFTVFRRSKQAPAELVA